MPRVHILLQGSPNVFNVVVHAPAPVGTNGAGVPWADALKNSGLAKTTMTVGNGPGQISSNEANQVAAGTLIEAKGVWQDDPNWTAAQRDADLEIRAQQLVDQKVQQFSDQLRLYGLTKT